jgi:membrane-bound lytic murein transglycosylase D
MRQGRSVLLVLLVCGLPASLAVAMAGETPFPRPDEMRGMVEFWVKVFALYDTDQVIVHDREDLTVVYGVEDLGGAGTAAQQTAQQEILARYRQALARLAEAPAGGRQMSEEERRVWQAHGRSRDPERYRRAADQLRLQAGQRDRFKQGLNTWRMYGEEMQRIFRQHGLPDSLVLLPFIESAFNPQARSKAGAVGLWQITRPAGQDLMRIDPQVDERLDPLKATAAAARILKSNYQTLGAWPLAITAYNHGLAGVARGVRESGTDDIAQLIRRYRGKAFGFASRNFYAEFLAALEVIANQRLYYGDEEAGGQAQGSARPEETAADDRRRPIAQLEASTPNPFNTATTIRYFLEQARFVQVDIYSVKGQRLRTLVREPQEAGSFQVSWDGTSDQGTPVGTGLYFVRLQAGLSTGLRKMMLLR